MTTVIASASVVVALASLFLSSQTQRRAERVACCSNSSGSAYRFLEIYHHLPLTSDHDERKAATRAYWHNAYDEWYITTRLTARIQAVVGLILPASDSVRTCTPGA